MEEVLTIIESGDESIPSILPDVPSLVVNNGEMLQEEYPQNLKTLLKKKNLLSLMILDFTLLKLKYFI